VSDTGNLELAEELSGLVEEASILVCQANALKADDVTPTPSSSWTIANVACWPRRAD
jgi:hypothetical protein